MLLWRVPWIPGEMGGRDGRKGVKGRSGGRRKERVEGGTVT